MDFKIRTADKNDTDKILEIERACFEYPWSRILFDADLSDNPHALYFVAEDKTGEILGFIGTHDIAGEINITNVAVKPEYQNRKIASALIEKTKEHFKGSEIIGITLEVASKNAPAIRVYEAAGFKAEGLRKGYYKNGDDAIIMWLR